MFAFLASSDLCSLIGCERQSWALYAVCKCISHFNEASDDDGDDGNNDGDGKSKTVSQRHWQTTWQIPLFILPQK